MLLAANDLASLEALGADLHLLTSAVLDNIDALDVRPLNAVGDAVGVADRAGGHRVLSADLTNSRHFGNSFKRVAHGTHPRSKSATVGV